MPKHRTKKERQHAQELREKALGETTFTYSIHNIAPTSTKQPAVRKSSQQFLLEDNNKATMKDLAKTIAVSLIVLVALLAIWKYQLI